MKLEDNRIRIIIQFNNSKLDEKDYLRNIILLQNENENIKNRFKIFIQTNKLNDKIYDEEYYWLGNIRVIDCDKSIIQKIIDFPGIKYIDIDAELLPNYVSKVEFVDNITSIQTGAKIINADKLWKFGITGKGVLVMNIDTGVLPCSIKR